jgi:peptide/nickel transport system ATP-binding protein
VLATPAHPYTRCLQLASPAMSAERRTLYVLPEQMPSLMQLQHIAGCHFAPRCPLVIAECRDREPPQVAVAADHTAACIRANDDRSINSTQGCPAVPTSSERTLLRVEGLSKRYVDRRGLLNAARTIVAAKDVSFSIAENEFVALVGESGSGKSTVAKLLVGLERPSAGRILFDGEDLAARSRRGRAARAERLQMVFQDPQSALNPRRRVASIVTQVMEAGGRHAGVEERLKRTKELLAEVGMPADLATRLPGQLSGGQRQRINIARALCQVPKVLIADEIVSGLDVSIQAQLLSLLARLRVELGFAMLFISHDLSVVRHLCSRVLVMYRGEIVEHGAVEQVFARPQHPHTQALLASVPPDEPSAMWTLLQAN